MKTSDNIFPLQKIKSIYSSMTSIVADGNAVVEIDKTITDIASFLFIVNFLPPAESHQRYQIVHDGLKIKNVTRDDKGLYTCKIYSPTTGDMNYKTIEFTVQRKYLTDDKSSFNFYKALVQESSRRRFYKIISTALFKFSLPGKPDGRPH